MTDVQPHQGASIEESPAPSRIPRLSLRPVMTRRYRVPRVGIVEARLWRMEVCPEEGPSRGDRPASPAGSPATSPAGSPATSPAVRLAISLEDARTRRLCLLGSDPSRAREILDLLVQNTVTPFGLRDVLEELT